MNTSYSALNTFQTCPLKYKYQEIDRIKTGKSPEAVFGTLIHATMKFIHSGSFLLPSEKDALNHFSTNWNADIFENEVQERMAFAMGIKIIQDYYRKNDPSQTKIVDLESRFTVPIEDKESKETHMITGFIDRIDKTDDGYEIMDYKTARKLPAQDSVEDNLQLLIYLLAFIKRYPDQEENISNIKLSLYFLKHGVKLSTVKTKEQIEAEKEKILETIRAIGKSDFPAVSSPLCDWCEYQRLCPMWKHKYKDEKTPDEEEQKKMIEEYVRLQAQIKEEKKKMMELQECLLRVMEKEGVERLFGEGKIVAKSCRKTFKYDEPVLKEILTGVGLWENVLKLDQIKLKKVAETLSPALKKSIDSAKELSSESWSLSVKKG